MLWESGEGWWPGKSLFPLRESRLCQKLDVSHRCQTPPGGRLLLGPAENIKRSWLNNLWISAICQFIDRENTQENCLKTSRVLPMSAFYRQITIVRSLFPPRKSRLCRKLDVCHRCRAENIMRSKFDDFRFRNSFTAQEKSRKNCVKTLRVKKVRQKLDVSHHCQTLPGERLSHTGLISSDSIQITTLTACITLKIQPFWLWKVILSLLNMSNQ